MDTTLAQQLVEELKRDVIYRFNEESLKRIARCLDKLTHAQIWWRPNEESNSVGNLILHLTGNIAQWILTGLGGQEDTRQRQVEFDTREGQQGDILYQDLASVIRQASQVILEQTPEDLLKPRAVQVFEETGISILVHVTEHLSYHTGQIAWITKMLRSEQLGFYDDIPLE